MAISSNQPVLQISGLNVTGSTARRRYALGELDRIGNGVYLRKDASPKERKQAVLTNAVRISMLLFPSGVLYGNTAHHLGHDSGAIHLGGAAADAVNIEGVLTIRVHQNNDGIALKGQVQNATVVDDFGDLSIKRFSDEYILLSAFRKRADNSEFIPKVSPNVQLAVAHRLLGITAEEPFATTPQSLEEKLSNMETAFNKDTKQAIRYLKGFESNAVQVPKVHHLKVFWHDRPVGSLSSDGNTWEFNYEHGHNLKLSLSEAPGENDHRVPNFMGAILPENSATESETLEERMELYTGACRFISNISVHPVKELGTVRYVPDILNARLSKFMGPESEFKGTVSPQMRETLLSPRMLNNARRNPEMPRISGMQMKLPCNLDRSGSLDLSVNKSFSHMVKLIGDGNEYSSMCSMEWFGLSVVKGVGLSVEDFAIADIGIGAPALVVERFDVREDYNDQNFILAEDLWSILGCRSNKLKYNGDLIHVARAVMDHSTEKSLDATQLLAQSMVSWLILNGDMHLKNLLMIKKTVDPRQGFTSVRLSPAYDMMCTQVFPNDAASAAITIDGNRQHTLHGFIKLGEVMGFSSDQVIQMASYISLRVANIAAELAHNLPPVIASHAKSASDINIATKLIDVRCGAMLDEISSYKAAPEKVRKVRASAVPDLNEVDAHLDAERRRSTTPYGMNGDGDDECFDASDVAPATHRARRSAPA